MTGSMCATECGIACTVLSIQELIQGKAGERERERELDLLKLLGESRIGMGLRQAKVSGKGLFIDEGSSRLKI